MRFWSVTADAAMDGKLLRHVLRQQMRLPQGFVSHLKFVPDGILLNGRNCHVDARVRAGDEVAVRIDDAGQGNPFCPVDAAGVRLVWEDEYLAILAKDAGIAVHGADVPERPTVANWAAYRWGAEQAFHPVNRLDRGTSGLMCAAKCGLIHDTLRGALHTERFERVYYAVCEGELAAGTGRIDRPIGRETENTNRRCVTEEGKPSVTDYECIAVGGGVSLVRLRLRTGRTHQIRVHMASLGHPLVGDTTYGGSAALPRPALHSAFMRLEHPVSGETLCFREPLPADISALLSEKACYFDENVLKYI